MRILLDWKKPETEIEYILAGLQKEHEVVYHIGFPENHGKSVSKAVFHDVFRAIKALPAEGHGLENLTPPSAELISKMYHAESVVLSMMNRKYGRKNVDERRHIYYTMLGYWHNILLGYRPDVVIFNAIPHATYNFVIYSLAKMMGIKTVMFVDTWEPDRVLLIEDYIKGSKDFDRLVDVRMKERYSADDLSPDLKKYYLSQITPKSDATPNYIKLQKKEIIREKKLSAKFATIIRSVKGGYFFKGLKGFLIRKFNKDARELAKKEYRALITTPDLNIPFIYVALHFQPERTTSPQGEMYVDQILMIETISHSLPEGWVLYVKEHPMQWWMRGSKDPSRFLSVRYPGYYKRIASLPNVRLIPPETDTFALMQKAKAVATVTGTVGFESLIRRKPVLLFGYSWYRNFPHLFKVYDSDSCKEALQDIFSGYSFDYQLVVNYLKAVDEANFYCFTDEFGSRVSTLDEKTNSKYVLEILNKHLKTLLDENSNREL